MPKYKSIKKKNHYKTLKYARKNKRKNKRKNTNKNNYRGGMPVSMSFFGRGSRSSRPPLSEVPVPEVPVPDVPVPDVPVPEVPVPQSISQASATALASAVLDPREILIKRLLRKTMQLLYEIQFIPIINNGLMKYAAHTDSQDILERAIILRRQLESTYISNDPRIIEAHTELMTKIHKIGEVTKTLSQSLVRTPARIY